MVAVVEMAGLEAVDAAMMMTTGEAVAVEAMMMTTGGEAGMMETAVVDGTMELMMMAIATKIHMIVSMHNNVMCANPCGSMT